MQEKNEAVNTSDSTTAVLKKDAVTCRL